MPEDKKDEPSIEEILAKVYPAPAGKKVMKISGSELEAIIIIPKGADVKADGAGYPAAQSDDSAKKALESAKKSLDAKDEQVKKLSEENVTLSKQLEEIKLNEKKSLIGKIIEAKLSNKSITPEEKDQKAKTYEGLDSKALEIVLSEIPAVKPAASDPSVKAKKGEEQNVKLSETEKREADAREILFGHRDPLP